MNINRLINLALRMLMKRGAGMTANRNGPPKGTGPDGRKSGYVNRQTMQKARRGMQILRRFMR